MARPKIHYDWSKADWTLRDTEIAKVIGCHRLTVLQRRKALNIPRHRLTERGDSGVRAAVAAAWRGDDPSRYLRSLGYASRQKLLTVLTILRRQVLKFRGEQTVPRTGQSAAFRAWLAKQTPGHEFRAAELFSGKDFTLQQIRNCISHEVRLCTVEIVNPKNGNRPATYRKS